MKERKPHFTTSIYIPEDKKEIMRQMEELAWRERKDLSPLVLKAIEDYLKAHGSGNPAYSLIKWQDNSDFKVTPAYLESMEKWKSYLDKCSRKELEEIEGKAIAIREEARSRWLAKRE